MTIPHEQEEMDKVVLKPGSWEAGLRLDDWLLDASYKQCAQSREATPATNLQSISHT